MRTLVIASMVTAAGCGGSGSGMQADAAGGNGTVTVTLTDRPDNAAMYSFVTAYRDGAGPWQLAPAPNGDSYTFAVTSPTWSFVWTCVPTNNEYRLVNLGVFATAEQTSLTQAIGTGCSDRLPEIGRAHV